MFRSAASELRSAHSLHSQSMDHTVVGHCTVLVSEIGNRPGKDYMHQIRDSRAPTLSICFHHNKMWQAPRAAGLFSRRVLPQSWRITHLAYRSIGANPPFLPRLLKCTVSRFGEFSSCVVHLVAVVRSSLVVAAEVAEVAEVAIQHLRPLTVGVCRQG